VSISGGNIPTPGDSARKLRVTAGYSLRGFAREHGYDFGYLSKVETGNRPMTPELARLYADLSAGPSTRPQIRPPRTVAVVTNSPPCRIYLGFTSFGAEIRRLRLDKGLSLREVGDAVHVSRSHLDRIELGQSRGDYQLALHLGIVVDHRDLAQLFLDEQAVIVAVVPGPGVLAEEAPPLTAAAVPASHARARRLASGSRAGRTRVHPAA